MNLILQIAAVVTKLIRDYTSRVKAGGGTVKNPTLTDKLLRFYKDQGLLPYVKVLILPEAGGIINTSGGSFWSKMFSLVGTNDLAQSTALSQPPVSNNIAPNDKLTALNPNGGTRVLPLTTTQTFSETDKWWLTWYGNWNGTNNAECSIVGKGSDTLSNLKFTTGSANRFSFTNESGTTVSGTSGNTNQLVGKKKRVDFVANGDGTLLIYVDTIYLETLTVATNVVFSQIIKGSSTAGREYYGSLAEFGLRTYTPSVGQLQAENSILTNAFQSVPSVQIGVQQWAVNNLDVVCTPMGSLIANVTDNTAWAASQATYDSTYEATSGSAAVKELAACKAAAMWCYTNNNASVGAVYGKLYNGYAIRLWELNRIAYDAAYPTTPWGWRMPTQADITTLQTTLGGASVAGGKMKKEGLTFWLSPNIGADNSSGFSAIPAGLRLFNGTFGNFNAMQVMAIIDNLNYPSMHHTVADLYPINWFTPGSNITGVSIRLIKN